MMMTDSSVQSAWNVLVIEDDTRLAEGVCAALQQIGIPCTSVASVTQAKQHYTIVRPHLVIIDHRLLGITVGSAFALWLCADGERATTIRISYSSSTTAEILGHGEPMYPPLFHAIVAKTGDPQDLIAVLAPWLPSFP